MNWTKNALIKVITDLVARKFYGTLTIKFQVGKITQVLRDESLTPE